MKQNKRVQTKSIINSYLYVTILLLLTISPLLIQAQPSFEEDIEDVPLDGGLSILLAAGGAYVLRKKGNNVTK